MPMTGVGCGLIENSQFCKNLNPTHHFSGFFLTSDLAAQCPLGIPERTPKLHIGFRALRSSGGVAFACFVDKEFGLAQRLGGPGKFGLSQPQASF